MNLTFTAQAIGEKVLFHLGSREKAELQWICWGTQTPWDQILTATDSSDVPRQRNKATSDWTAKTRGSEQHCSVFWISFLSWCWSLSQTLRYPALALAPGGNEWGLNERSGRCTWSFARRRWGRLTRPCNLRQQLDEGPSDNRRWPCSNWHRGCSAVLAAQNRKHNVRSANCRGLCGCGTRTIELLLERSSMVFCSVICLQVLPRSNVSPSDTEPVDIETCEL